MKIHQRFEHGAAILSLRGTLFSPNAVNRIKRAILSLERSGNKNLILDFGEVRYLNSPGISALLFARKIMARANGTLSLRSANANIMDILQRTALVKHFLIAPSPGCACSE